jgi:hypothetical protein
MKKISLKVMGEKFEINLEDEFFEFVKEDLVKLQNPTPRELLFFILEKNKKEYEILKKLEKISKDIK